MNLLEIPIEEYHKADAVSWSKLHVFMRSPIDYWHKYIVKDSKAEGEKDYFRIGNAFEDALTNTSCKIKVADLDNWRGKEAGIIWDKIVSSGKIPLSKPEKELVDRMVAATHKNKEAMALIAKAKYQKTLRKDIAGITLQCRPDMLIEEEDGTIIDCDIKTTDDITRFGYQAADLKYHCAAAFYQQIIKTQRPESKVIRKFLVVDKQEWPTCQVMTLPDSYLEEGTKIILGSEEQEGALIALLRCIKSNKWPSLPESVDLSMPMKWQK